MIAVLVEAALRAMVVALTVWAGLRLFRVRNVEAQKAAWCLMLAAAVAVPMVMRWKAFPAPVALHVPASLWQRSAQPAANANVSQAVSLEMVANADRSIVLSRTGSRTRTLTANKTGSKTSPANTVSTIRLTAQDAAAGTSAPAVARSAQAAPVQNQTPSMNVLRRLPIVAIATTIYLLVLGALLFRLGQGLYRAARVWRGAERAYVPVFVEGGILELHDLPVRASAAVASPVTIGSGVVLPADYSEWDAEKLRIVLAHERSHVRQGDFYLQVLAGVYAAVFWFSPLGWWLKRELSELGEAISDRAGLEEAASRTSYAQVLLEFAALPRPTALGVAMARSSNLSHRIERLLNEASFRQAFAGSRRRVLLAALLVPVALFAGTALVRVEAQSSPSEPAPKAPVAPNAAVTPDSAQVPVPASAPVPVPAPAQAPDTAAAPDAVPTPAAAPDAVPVPPAAPEAAGVPIPSPDEVPAATPVVAPMPPMLPRTPDMVAPPPPNYREIHDAADDRVMVMSKGGQDETHVIANDSKGRQSVSSSGKGYSYSYSSDGDSWGLVTDASGKVTFSGDWHDSTRAMIDKVRKMTNGKFLWFTHDGKSYFIDDASVVDGVQALYKPMEELGRKQDELGKQQEALGRKQEELGKKQEEVSIPTPDMTKELAQLNELTAKLAAKKGSTISQDELSNLQEQIGELQGKIGELQGEMGSKQGEFGEKQGELGEQQGKLGEQQGQLGEEQGRIAEEADRKVKSIIAESLREGKARPVE